MSICVLMHLNTFVVTCTCCSAFSFQQFVQDSGDEASDDEGLLTRRHKTQEEKVAQPQLAL